MLASDLIPNTRINHLAVLSAGLRMVYDPGSDDSRLGPVRSAMTHGLFLRRNLNLNFREGLVGKERSRDCLGVDRPKMSLIDVELKRGEVIGRVRLILWLS